MKIICIGKNYALHAKEMESSVPEKPVFFLKPDTALLTEGNDFYYPDFTTNLHHEIELVLKISKNGKNIQPEFIQDYVKEYSLGIDFTARDLQDEAKKKGMPWEIAKAFDQSAFISKTWLPFPAAAEFGSVGFSLKLNKIEVQAGTAADMIFNPAAVISYVSKFITLRIGDLIYTGTPHGVGPVKQGDTLEGLVGNTPMFSLAVK
ncbi:MAG: fumarylacetoacetate hydrolase family protein [Flavobacteriales bacterium]